MALRNGSNRIVTSIRSARYCIEQFAKQSIVVEVSKPETLALIVTLIMGAFV
ncbi:MAG: hypothetical protein ITG07_12005 [Candidimonas sp.]|nr:hypothetical protein [Candidimonas sp.]